MSIFGIAQNNDQSPLGKLGWGGKSKDANRGTLFNYGTEKARDGEYVIQSNYTRLFLCMNDDSVVFQKVCTCQHINIFSNHFTSLNFRHRSIVSGGCIAKAIKCANTYFTVNNIMSLFTEGVYEN